MIATGGLLRINARRQDSLRSKTHKPHTHKKKSKKKSRSEVVVVKGKLHLCSLSGLVAALGIMVLLVGVVMAGLGYWPRNGLFFSSRPQEGATLASVTSSDAQGGEEGEQLRGGGEGGGAGGDARGGGRGDGEAGGGGDGGEGGDEGFNRTESINGTAPQGFLEDFLKRYLYSDRLKVFGPLIMGIGIFLFICANAVLHENRDRKTKVINLRDIYSTVIDLHSLKRPTPSQASANPLNGLVNYVQSKSLEAKPRAYPASLLGRREGGELSSRQPLPSSSEGGRGRVYSIYQGLQDTPPSPCSSHRLSLPPSFKPAPPSLSSSTLPLRRPRAPSPRRRHSARAGSGRGWGQSAGGGGDRQEEMSPLPVVPSPPPPPSPFQSSSSLSPSHLSVSSLSHLLASSSPMLALPCRRRSLPAVYSKLSHSKGEWTETAASHHVTSQVELTSHRQYSNKVKLRMISLRRDDQSETD